MAIGLRTAIVVDKNFRNLIKSQRYEDIILTILNRSSEIFKDKYFTSNIKQDNGQCDFVDEQGEKYEAKLVLDELQGQHIGDKKFDLSIWLQDMLREKKQFSDCIHRRDLSTVIDMKLFKIIKKRLMSVKEDENAILFIPFNIVDDFKDSYFIDGMIDFLQAIYERLKESNEIECKSVYFIYPSMEPEVYVLRDSGRNREYIECDELSDYIYFETTISMIN